jgi:hypothetical protein
MVLPSQTIDKLLFYCMRDHLVAGTASQTPSQLESAFSYEQLSLFINGAFASYGDSRLKNSRNSLPKSVNPNSPLLKLLLALRMQQSM